MGHAGLTAVVFAIIVVSLSLTGCAIFKGREVVITTGFGYWIPDSLHAAAARYHAERLRTFYPNPTIGDAEACWEATLEVYGIVSYGVYVRPVYGKETFVPYDRCSPELQRACDESLIFETIEIE